MRLTAAILAVVAEALALVIGVIAVFRFGLEAGLVIAVALSFSAPVAVAGGLQHFTRGRWIVTPWVAAAPVWIAVAAMSRLFTSFRIFADGDTPRWEMLAVVAAAAALGGAVATRPR